MTWGVDSPVNLQFCLMGMGWLVDVLWGGGVGSAKRQSEWHIIVDAEKLVIYSLRLLLLEQGQFFNKTSITFSLTKTFTMRK